MIELTVTGETPEEFAENAMKAWGLLAIGLQSVVNLPRETVAPPTEVMQTTGSENSSSASKGVHSDLVDDLFTESATTLDGSSQAPRQSEKPKNGSKSAKGPRLDDLKTRLSDVITAAVGRGWAVPRANAYARKLLRQWGVEKLGDLPAADYAQFMLDSVPYVDGTAAE